jgi:hypothetical protein
MVSSFLAAKGGKAAHAFGPHPLTLFVAPVGPTRTCLPEGSLQVGLPEPEGVAKGLPLHILGNDRKIGVLGVESQLLNTFQQCL